MFNYVSSGKGGKKDIKWHVARFAVPGYCKQRVSDKPPACGLTLTVRRRDNTIWQ